jgi:hypothetical protein
MLLEAVKWCGGGWYYRRRIDLGLKKSDLKTVTNLATDTEEKAESMVEKETSAVVKP